MKFIVDGETFEDIEAVLDYCISDDYYDDDDYFEEWVNETYGSIEIAGDTYYAYDIIDNAGDGNMNYLHERYNEDKNDNDRDETRYQLEHASDGDEIYCQNYVIKVVDDKDYDEEDENENSSRLEDVRRFVDEQKLIEQQKKETDKQNEDAVMTLFQVISCS